MTEQQEIKLIRKKATKMLIESGVFSKKKLNNLSDNDFFKFLDIVNSAHTRKETA
jgi:hypothetical protein